MKHLLVAWVTGFVFATFGCNSIVYGEKQNQFEVLSVDSAKQDPNSKFVWYDAAAIGIEGKGWSDTDGHYTRLPENAKGVISEDIWNLGKHSAGLYVRFATDSNTILARWKLTGSGLSMFHMTSIGVSGLDLYMRDGDKWREIGIGRPLKFPTNEDVLASGLKTGGKMNEYVLYLPLYNGVESLEIGVAAGTKMAKGTAWPAGMKPIVIYGTSIVQGACATRPGLAHTNILQRRLNRPVINLGFSGGARLESEMADLLCQIDAAVYVLDPVPNSHVQLINERFENFVTKIHNAHPKTPIIVCESICFPNTDYLAEQGTFKDNAALKSVYERLQSKGIKTMYYLKRNDYIGTDGEAFVDLVHPNDLGFMRMADALEPILRKAMK